MRVVVQLFAVARQLADADRVELELPPRTTVGGLRSALADAVPALAEVLPHVTIAVDAEYADEQTCLQENAAIAIIPPVSGG